MPEKFHGVEGPEEGQSPDYDFEDSVVLGEGGRSILPNPEITTNQDDDSRFTFLFAEGGVQTVLQEFETVMLAHHQDGKRWSDVGGFVLSIPGLVSLIHAGMISESIIDNPEDVGEKGGTSESEVDFPVLFYNLLEYGQKVSPLADEFSPNLRKKIRVMNFDSMRQIYGIPEGLLVNMISVDQEWRLL